MSTFSDEDLKEYLRKYGDVMWHMSLLTRLEAAEFAVLCFQVIPKEYRTARIEEALEAHRKSAGKNDLLRLQRGLSGLRMSDDGR